MNDIGRDKLTLLAVKILEGLFYWNTTSGYHNFVKGVWVLGIQFCLFWFCAYDYCVWTFYFERTWISRNTTEELLYCIWSESLK